MADRGQGVVGRRLNRDVGRRSIKLTACALLGASLVAQAPARARDAGKPFTSIRYGYALMLPPGWSLVRGDCAPYALAVSADKADSIEIHVTSGSGAAGALRQAEAKALHMGGRLQGTIVYGSLRTRNATYRMARASVRAGKAVRDMLVAGIARNRRVYLVIDVVDNPASRRGRQNAKAGQGILASLTFARPAAPGTFTCAGSGVSRRRRAGSSGQASWFVPNTPTPRVPNRAVSKRTPAAKSSTPTAPPEVPSATPSLTATPLPSSTTPPTALPSFTGTPSATGTPIPSPTNPPTWTPTGASTPTATALPTTTALPTATPTASDIPTTGFTDNGCAITPDQAAGEAQLLSLLNADRAAAGVPQLTLFPALSVVSRDHSCDMATHDARGSLSPIGHNGSNGLNPAQRVQAAGISFNMLGENIGVVTSSISGAVEFLDEEMMAEPLTPDTHHWNIVNAGYHHVGLGVISLQGSVWVTEDFID